MTRCRLVRTDHGRERLTYEHRLGCEAVGCPGCAPCTAPHCWRCQRTHLDNAHPITCPSCVGRTRTDLAAIERLYTLLPTEAEQCGVDSEAANLAGPAADPEASQWYRAHVWAQTGALEPSDPHHPLTVLGTWDFMLREDLNQTTELRVTVSRSVDYLSGLLTWLAQADDQDFPLFAEEIRVCRVHLENVLHEGDRAELGVECPDCETSAPRLVLHRGSDPSGVRDEYRCPADRDHKWTIAEYRKWVADDYLANARRLTASQIRTAHRVPEGSTRAWAALGKVDKRGRDHSGRVLYDVAQVLALRDAVGSRGA